MARADKYTKLSVTPIYYTDFLTSFEKNPTTGAVASVNNDEAIKMSLKNLILTNRGERPFNSQIGSKIRAMLFEPYIPETTGLIIELIKETIRINEPRVQVNDVRLTDDSENNGLYITIIFSMINIPRQVNFTFFISRVR